MRRSLLALLAGLVLLLPVASAQVPDTPDVVTTVCGALPIADQVPLCPQPEPAAPADPHEHTPAPQPPAAPEDAQQLADDAAQQAGGIVDEPATAPERVAALAATIVQFVKDLIQVPVDAAQALAAETLEKAAAAKAAAGAALDDVRARIGELFARAGVQQPDATKQPKVRSPKTGTLADSLVDQVSSALPRVG